MIVNHLTVKNLSKFATLMRAQCLHCTQPNAPAAASIEDLAFPTQEEPVAFAALATGIACPGLLPACSCSQQL